MQANSFDHKFMLKTSQEILEKIDDLPAEPFLLMLRETLKIFEQMGGALAMAFAG